MSDRTHTLQPKPRDNFRKWDDPAYNAMRRQKQAAAKIRKAANAARAAAKAAKEARPMSAKKRRHLEDKAK